MLKKLGYLILCLGVVIVYFRAELGLFVMQRGLDHAMSASPLDAMGDGLYLSLCGAGGPLPDDKRSGPCVAIVAGEQFYVVDGGSGGARNLAAARMPMGSLDGVLLTHFHSDHIDGLGELALMRWVQGANNQRLPVYGPDGVEEVVAGFNQAYAKDARYRQAHHGDTVAPLSGGGMQAVAFAVPAERHLHTVIETGELKIQALRVAHSPVEPAVGYVINYKGRSVLISGDTRRADNLQHFAQGVDLLVHEALSYEMVAMMQSAAARNGNQVMARIAADIPDYHTSPLEAAEIASAAQVKHLLYYHVIPPLPVPGAESAWLRGVDAVFPEHTLGRDGTAFFLPSNSDKIERLQ